MKVADGQRDAELRAPQILERAVYGWRGTMGRPGTPLVILLIIVVVLILLTRL